MKTTTHEIASGIHRLSTCVPDAAPGGFTFNQFLIVADEPLLFHTGPRGMFPLVSEAIASIVPVESLRWIMFGHFESDECGAMNELLDAAPEAKVAHGRIACMTSLNDICQRPPRQLADGEVMDLGGKRVRYLDTPHVPHNWESGMLFEETTRTLLCGDLFTHTGNGPAITTDDIVPAAMETEALFKATALSASTAPTIRELAQLQPDRLAVMHGSSFEGDCSDALERLATAYDELLTKAQRPSPR